VSKPKKPKKNRTGLTPRKQLERLAQIILDQAATAYWSPKRLRAEMRVRGAELAKHLGVSPRMWQRARHKVTGRLYDLPDLRQTSLF
jgi:hypothetical protein